MNLLNETLALIESSDLTLTKIANDCGVSYRWLMMLRKGDSPDAGVGKVQRMHDYLVEHEQRKAKE